MSKENQIEEMDTDITAWFRDNFYEVGRLSNYLYNKGYRKQEWISVDDRLPEDGGMYLVYNPSRMVSKVVTARYSKGENRWCSADACCYHEGIIHWMPLPPQPAVNGHNWATVVPEAPNACDELAAIVKKIDEIFNDENVSEETKAMMSAEFIGMFTGNIGKIGKMKG